MKFKSKIVKSLNELLTAELIAVNRYIAQAGMWGNGGYPLIHDAIKNQAVDDMKHAEKLMARIVSLEGALDIGDLSNFNPDMHINEQLKNDSIAESNTIKLYHTTVDLAMEAGDVETADLLRSIIQDTAHHLEHMEAIVEESSDLQLQKYLVD